MMFFELSIGGRAKTFTASEKPDSVQSEKGHRLGVILFVIYDREGQNAAEKNAHDVNLAGIAMHGRFLPADGVQELEKAGDQAMNASAMCATTHNYINTSLDNKGYWTANGVIGMRLLFGSKVKHGVENGIMIQSDTINNSHQLFITFIFSTFLCVYLWHIRIRFVINRMFTA
nr:hypothetical protein [Caenibacillus caldisaponilyticus]